MSDIGNKSSLIECMQEVPDPRAPYNQKHKFIDIIMIAVMAILCGMDTWNEIEDWARSKKEWLGSFLELPGGIPSRDTILKESIRFRAATKRTAYTKDKLL